MTLLWHDEVDSTQDVAHDHARAGATHGSAVVARRQRVGRGTRARPWASDAGGLWLSVIGRPGHGGSLDALGLRVGLGVAEAIEAVTGLEPGTIGLKWPNDLVLADRKLAGILCEARWRGEVLDWVVVGVGVNVANELPPDLAHRAHRLAELGWTGGPEPLAGPVVDAVVRALARAGPLVPDEIEAYRARDWLLGRELTGRWAGVVCGVSAHGRLIVEQADGNRVEVSEAVTWADLAPFPTGR